MKREYAIQIIVDNVQISHERVPQSSRLDGVGFAFSITNLPVVHILPSQEGELNANMSPDHGSGLVKIPFHGAGKSCVLDMTQTLIDKGRIIFLIVKHVEALDDYIIITTTTPLTIKDFCLSLPSGTEDTEPAFVTRELEFLDDIGHAEVRMRIVRMHPKPKKQSIPVTIRKRTTPDRENEAKPLLRHVPTVSAPATIPRTPPKVHTHIREIQSKASPQYGTLRSRTVLLSL